MADNPAEYNPWDNFGDIKIPAPVSSDYCVPYVADFEVDQRHVSLRGGRFKIKDLYGTTVFEVQNKKSFPLHVRRELTDASGKVLVLLKRKIATMRDKWTAYRGEDDSESNLLFTIFRSSLIQLLPSYDIFLPMNHTSTPDFQVKGDVFQVNYSILFNGIPIAEAGRNRDVSDLVDKESYGITVHPAIDLAFIASVLVVIDEVKETA